MAMELARGYIDLTLRDRKFLAAATMIDAKLKSMHLKMQGVASAAKRMLLIGGGAIAGAVAAYGAFEKQLATVSTMLDEQSMRIMPTYAKALKRMAVAYGESTATLSKGLYDILSASIATTKALAVLETSVKAARGGITTTAVAADAITTILNSYSLSAENAADVSDLLFAIVKKGKLTFEELATRIGRVASIAAQTGLSLEEVGAAIATMTRAGLQADIAITSLRALLMSFMKPTVEAATFAVEKFGFELNTATLRTIGLTGVLKKLKGATAEQLAILIPNTRGLSGFAASLQNVEGQVSDLELMLNRTGLALEAFNKMVDTQDYALKALWQSLKLIGVTLGESFSPKIVAATEKLRKFNIEISKYIEKNGEAILKTIAWTGGIALAVIALAKLLGALIVLKPLLKFFIGNPIGVAFALSTGLVYSWSKLGEEIGELITNTKGLEEELKIITKASNEYAAATEDVFIAQEKLSKAIVASAEAREKGTRLEYLEKEKAVVIALHDIERKRIAALRVTPNARKRIEHYAEQIKQSRILMSLDEQRLAIIVDEIKLLETKILKKQNETRWEINRTKASLASTERIKDLELEIAKIRGDGIADLAALNRKNEKLMLKWEERSKKARSKMGGVLPKTFEQEWIAIQELYDAKEAALFRKQADKKLKKEKEVAKRLAEYRKQLERDFILYTEGALSAQLYDLKLEYEELSAKFKKDAEAMTMLETVMGKKLEEISEGIKTDQRLNVVDPSSMWRQMIQTMGRLEKTETQKRLLDEFILSSRREERAEITAAQQRQKTVDYLRDISFKGVGLIRR